MGTSLWVLLLKLLDLFEGLLDYFVNVYVVFEKSPLDYQWTLVHLHSMPTEKGWNVLDAIVTIIHNGLDFVAQFMTLLPAQDGLINTNMGAIHVT